MSIRVHARGLLDELWCAATRKVEEDDSPEWGYDRRWRWEFWLNRTPSRIGVGLQMVLTQFKGEVDDTPVRYRCIDLIYDPRKWRALRAHTWYDGEWCSYELGPFAYHSHGTDCDEYEKIDAAHGKET